MLEFFFEKETRLRQIRRGPLGPYMAETSRSGSARSEIPLCLTNRAKRSSSIRHVANRGLPRPQSRFGEHRNWFTALCRGDPFPPSRVRYLVVSRACSL